MNCTENREKAESYNTHPVLLLSHTGNPAQFTVRVTPLMNAPLHPTAKHVPLLIMEVVFVRLLNFYQKYFISYIFVSDISEGSVTKSIKVNIT